MTREDLESFTADEPPPGFVDRVMAARQLELEPPRWKMRLGLAISVGVAALAAVAAFGVRPGPPPRAGAVVPTERQTLAIGDRAIAVAEAGSDISWTVRAGAARVVLPRGDVFFRVEPGAPFVVATPAGDVEVKGTCFRVEVSHMMPSKQALAGAAVGAALTAAVVVTVYEGKVLFANEHGKAEVGAGQSARAESGRAPEAAAPERKVVAKVLEAPAPPRDNATREELLERDRVQRQELQALRQKVAELEHGGGADTGDLMKQKKGTSFFDPTKDELLAMAKNCEVRFDSPNMEEPNNIDPEVAQEVGLTDADRQAANAAFAEAAEKLRAQIRAIYVEATGNANAPEDLTTMAMWQEIQQKSRREDVASVTKTLSAERAGLQAPPADLASRSPYERAMRLISSSGNNAEAAVAQAIGPEKARALRAANGGWSSRFAARGCRDREDKDVVAK